MSAGAVVKGLVVPGLPQPLLAPEKNEGWGRIRRACEAAAAEIREAKPDLLLLYSTLWPSVIGHQIQADPEPEWVHVDELFHDLGSIPYRFRIDAAFAEAYRDAARARGLHARTVAYHGFPIDTGSVVTLKLIDPENAVPACIVSSNVYADRAETLVLGKAAADAIAASGRRAVAVAVTTLSNRLFTDWIDPAEDRIHSPKDEEWNRKVLEFLADGRLEDVSQLSREIHRQIRVKKVVNFKPMWWLAATMGQSNNYVGKVYDYAPIYGTGAAVVTLTPTGAGVGDKEFDEEDVEFYRGDRSVLRREDGAAGEESAEPPAGSARAEDDRGEEGMDARGEGAAGPALEPKPHGAAVHVAAAPRPMGAYAHARRAGGLLFLAGIGPRRPSDDAIPGGPVRDERGRPLDYDIEAQTRAVIENVRTVLEASGSSFDSIIDVTVYLIDMDRDFAGMNRVWKEHFEGRGVTRTTVAIRALPTPIAVEFKVVAAAGP